MERPEVTYDMESWCDLIVQFLERPPSRRGYYRTVTTSVFLAANEDERSGMVTADWAFEQWKEAKRSEDKRFWHDVILAQSIRRQVRRSRGKRLLEIIVKEDPK